MTDTWQARVRELSCKQAVAMRLIRRLPVFLQVAGLFFILAVCVVHGAAENLGSERDSKQALRELFTSLDRDGDGQIREAEASMYIKTQTGQAAKLVKEEAEQLMASLDGSDTDDTISIEELEKSLGLRGQVCNDYSLEDAQT